MPPSRNSRTAQDLKDLNDYYQFLESKQHPPFHCPHCGTRLTPKAYQDHCTEHHDLNAKLCCVWCSGNVAWPARTDKYLHASHLKQCACTFLARIHSFTGRPFDRTPLCAAKDTFGRPARNTHPLLYRHVWPLPLPILSWQRPAYDVESLNRAAACLRVFLDPEDEKAWYRVRIRADGFPSFVEALDSDEGRTHTLPFWCWCDAPRQQQPQHQYRHMIIVSLSEEHFERNVRPKIQASEERIRRIRSPMELVNALEHVCRRECDGDKKRHYYVRESLPKDFKLLLVMEWEEGCREFLEGGRLEIGKGSGRHGPASFQRLCSDPTKDPVFPAFPKRYENIL